MYKKQQDTTLLSLLKPQYWLLWLGIGLLWTLTRLPLTWQLSLGRLLGRLFYHFAPRRRHIARVNLQLCFPELTPLAQQQLLRQHFESLGMGLFEMLSAWWASDQALDGLGQIEGLVHLQAGLQQGKGVILLSAHVTSLEIGTRFLTLHTPIHAIYRPHENPVIEYLMQKNRAHHAEKAIPRDEVREMLRSLKQNKALWLAIDQNFGHKNSVFAPFFNIPAATNIAVTRLTELSGAVVIPFFTRRLSRGYAVTLQPPLANFPSNNVLQDATRINQLIEQHVRLAPEQYLWVHRRFKDRPVGESDLYLT